MSDETRVMVALAFISLPTIALPEAPPTLGL